MDGKTVIAITFSKAELTYLRWAVQDAVCRGLDERMMKEALQRRIEAGLGLKDINQPDGS